MSFKSMSFKKCKDLILGVAMLLFSGFYLLYAQQIKTLWADNIIVI